MSQEIKLKKKAAQLSYCWCLMNLKRSKYHDSAPKIEIKSKKSESFRGYFSPRKNIICIFLENHESFDDICQTVIHEWKHYQQNLKMYDRYITLYRRNFQNHPYEKVAENFAIKKSKDCLTWINSNMHLSTKKITNLCIKSI